MVILTLLKPQGYTAIQNWNFPQQSVIRIGRAGDNHIILEHYPEVSRYHLELKKIDNSSWQLISRGTNGTFLNGILITQGLLTNGSIIQLAKKGPILRFQTQSTQEKNGVAFPNCPLTHQPCGNLPKPPKYLFCIYCGYPLVEKERFIRQYQILRTLGQGGMGTTYLAWDKNGQLDGSPNLLVLKEMNADMAAITKAQELFEREARILKSLNHSGVPNYYDFFVEKGKKYLAMELIHGQNLEERIYQKGPITPKHAIRWMMQTCDILSYLHSLQPPLVHRDVKPANLMARNVDGRIVLLDFGAVKEIGTPFGTRIGAEGYSAPEQDRGKPCPQSDLYAIGPTLIFLLTGEAPLKYYRDLGDSYGFDIKSIPTITPRLGHVINKTCERKLSERYQTAEELSQALAKCL